jgi:hypothetical protein
LWTGCDVEDHVGVGFLFLVFSFPFKRVRKHNTTYGPNEVGTILIKFQHNGAKGIHRKRIRRKSQATELLEGSNPMKKQLGI